MKKMKIQVKDFAMQLEAQQNGKDLLIVITGGDTPHIGTVTTWEKTTQQKKTLRFESHDGRLHKDDVLADIILDQITPYLIGNCVVTSGVHVDGISKDQINASLKMAEALGIQLAEALQQPHL